MKPLIAAAAVAALTACSAVPSATDQAAQIESFRSKSITQARAECSEFGLAAGSGEYIACVDRRSMAYFTSASSAYAARVRAIESDETAASWAIAGAAMSANAAAAAAYRPVTPAYVAPAMVTCRTFGATTHCF